MVQCIKSFGGGLGDRGRVYMERMGRRQGGRSTQRGWGGDVYMEKKSGRTLTCFPSSISAAVSRVLLSLPCPDTSS